jgi:hypothetical protein
MEKENSIVNIDNLINLKESQLMHKINIDKLNTNSNLYNNGHNDNNSTTYEVNVNYSLIGSVYNYIKCLISPKETIQYEYTTNHV